MPAPGGQNHRLASQDVSLDRNLGRREEPRVSLAEIDPRLPDIAVTVATPDRVDDALDAVDHLRPIHPGVLDRDPEPAGGAGFMKRVSGANKRLRGIAAGVEAGATHFPLLDHGYARALAACFGRGGAPGGASADDDQIVWCAGTPVIESPCW